MKQDLQDHLLAVYNAIISGGLQRDLLPPGREWKETSQNLITNCPFPDHEDRNPSFSISKSEPKFICTCSRSGNYLQLIAALEGLPYKPLRDEAFKIALARLERIAGIPPMEYSPEAQARHEQARRRGDVITAAAEYFQECLKTDAGTLKYLEGRGYTRADIEAAGLGSFPGFQKTFDHLRGLNFEAAEIYTPPRENEKHGGGALPWLKSWPDHQLAIPFYDITGTAVTGIKVRPARDLKPGEPKYPPLTDMGGGFKTETLYNLDKARGKHLILVEGLLDAAILTARGVPASALDGAELYPGQIAQAMRYGTEYFILALDNDKAGKTGTRKAILELSRLDPPRRAYVVNYPQGIKDADELIKAQGIEAFKAALKQKETAGRWIAAQGIEDMPANPSTYDYYEAFKDLVAGLSPIDCTEALDELNKFYPQEGLQRELAAHREKERAKQEQKAIDAKAAELPTAAQEILNEKGPEAALEFMTREVQELAGRRALADKSDKPFYTIPEYLQDEKHEPAGLKTGLKDLDKYILFPSGAISVIAARVKHGKTTLMLNLMRNQLAGPENKGKAFFYFSYEQPKKQLMRRLVMMESSYIVDDKLENMNYSAIGEMLKEGGEHKKVNDALGVLDGYIQAERLALIDHPYFVDELAGMLKKWAGRYEIGGVYIDYIQKVKIKGRYQSRQAEIQAISAGLLEAAVSLKIPVIVGSQANRTVTGESNLTTETMRESGDIEQDANLILGLWDRSRGNEKGDPEKGSKVTLAVKILENRDGGKPENDGAIELWFNKPILRITDKTNFDGTGKTY